jgi:hypothetical protein
MVSFTLTEEQIEFLSKYYEEQPEAMPVLSALKGNSIEISDDEYCDFIDWVDTASVTDGNAIDNGVDADGEPDEIGLMLEQIYDSVYMQTN